MGRFPSGGDGSIIPDSGGGIIDVHAHVLPGVDDGARDMEEAEALLRAACSQGIRAVVATPHYSRRKATDRQQLEELARTLQERMRRHDPRFAIYLGQETYYHEELPERLRQGQALTIAGSGYVLVEFEPSVPYQTLFRGIRRISGAGYIPVLAHMERYACLRQEGRVRELRGCGCLMQMNYDSLRGLWFNPEVRWCRRQVLDGNIHMLGTDMHRLDFRPPRISEALRWLRGNLSRGQYEAITFSNAGMMLDNVGSQD